MSENDNRFAARVNALSDDDFAELERAVACRKCREKVGFGTFDETLAAYRPTPACPSCGGNTVKNGRTGAGHQRYRCPACRRRFSTLSGTIFENCKKDFPTWVSFVELMAWNVPVDAAASICGISHQTTWGWRHRVFATVDGCQDRIVLRGRIWIDEAYVNDTDPSKGYGEARKRGLSKQKICIAVAIDEHKSPVAVVCGHGKPSSKRIKDGLLKHIAEGSHIVHDKEKAHNATGQSREVHRRGVQGRRARPNLSGMHVDGEQPLLVDQALPLALHGHGSGQPAVVPQLVCVPCVYHRL